MRLLTRMFLVALLVTGLTVAAYANGLNLNGVGARAISMGGAFVGLADDYSAVFWNPAGLTQLKGSNISLSASFIIPKGSYQYSTAGIDEETLSAVHTAPTGTYFKQVSDNMVIGFAAYATAGAGAEYDGANLRVLNPAFALGDTTAYTWKSYVAAMTFSPVLAYKLNDSLSIGITFNLVYGMLKFDRPALGQYSEDLKGLGFGATIGLLYQLSDAISFGLTYKTPQKIKVKGDAGMSGYPITTSEAEREVTWPMWLGAGIALKPMDGLTITFDAQWTNWKQMDLIGITFDEAMWNVPVPGVGQTIAEMSEFQLLWKDAVQIRFGLEYYITEKIALRAGYYYDPSPAPDTTLNILLPEITYNILTIGLGYKTENMSLNIGFEYFKGKEAEADMSLGHAMPGLHNNDIMVPVVGFTYKF